MWKNRLLGLLLVFLLSSSVVYADVVLTDEQATELDQTLDELETVLKEQQTTIDNLQKQNNELQSDSENKQVLLNEQQTKINELNDLLDEHEKSSVMRVIWTVTISVLAGIVIGLLI